MVVNAKCNLCKEPTKYVAGFFDGPRGRHGCLFDCKNEQCEKAGEFAERYLHKGTKTIMPQKFDLKIQ